MKFITKGGWIRSAVVAGLLCTSASALAEDQSLSDRINSLEQQVQELKKLLAEQNKAATPSKHEIATIKQDVSEIKSKQDEWKTYKSVVHLAGYGAASYNSDAGHFTQAQFSPIFHYSYSDQVMMEAEVEMAVGPDDEAQIDLEYASMDVFLNDYMAVTAGRFLSPIGQFVQNQHPSWVNKMPSMPAGFGHESATPVSDLGVMVHGGARSPVGKDAYINYAAYVGNGPVIELNEDGDGIEMIAAEGFTSDADGNKTVGGRIGFLPIPGLEIGVSAGGGNIAIPGEANRDYRVYDVDFAGRWRQLSVRGEWVRQSISALASSVVPDEFVLEAWYGQASWRFTDTNWEAIARYSNFDSPNPDQAHKQWALGLDYWFNSHTVAKFDYESNDAAAGEPVGNNRFLVQLGYGF